MAVSLSPFDGSHDLAAAALRRSTAIGIRDFDRCIGHRRRGRLRDAFNDELAEATSAQDLGGDGHRQGTPPLRGDRRPGRPTAVAARCERRGHAQRVN